MSQHRHTRPWKPDMWIYGYNLAYTIWHIQEPPLLRCTILHRCTYQLVNEVHNAGGSHVIFHLRRKPRETRTHTHTHTDIYIYIYLYIHTHTLTYLLTPWSRVLLEKLTGSAARQEIPRIFGTRRFLTVFTSAHHMSLSWANSVQSPQPPPTSWRSISILSSHLPHAHTKHLWFFGLHYLKTISYPYFKVMWSFASKVASTRSSNIQTIRILKSFTVYPLLISKARRRHTAGTTRALFVKNKKSK